MREHGYVLDRDFIVEGRFADGEVGRLPALVAELVRAIATMQRERMQAFIALPDAIYSQQMEQIARSALKHRLPSSFIRQEYPEAGGLMSYGQNVLGNWRLGAKFIDKIFKGAKPGDLPFEQPATFDLVINMKTAQALGIKVPQTILLQASKVIE